jgi:hypothetical protein
LRAHAGLSVLNRGRIGRRCVCVPSRCCKQRLGALEAALPVLGQQHGVRGALQQPQAQRALQRLQPAAHRGLRGAELGCGRRQAAGFDDAHEGRHQREPVHGAGHAALATGCGQ